MYCNVNFYIINEIDIFRNKNLTVQKLFQLVLLLIQRIKILKKIYFNFANYTHLVKIKNQIFQLFH